MRPLPLVHRMNTLNCHPQQLVRPLKPVKSHLPCLDGLDLLASAVLILDAEDRVAYANAAAENLLESSFKMLAQQRFPELFVNGAQFAPLLREAHALDFAD